METTNDITTPAVSTTESVNPNAEIANAFDALARFYHDNPQVKAPYYPTIHVFLNTLEEMSAILDANLGMKTGASTDYFSATKMFGTISLTYLINASKCGTFEDKEVTTTTTKKVWVPIVPEFAVEE